MYSVQNITASFGGTDLFRNVTFIINPKDRIGLVGKNGSGKTTLLKFIARIQSPANGEIVIPNGKTIGYLPQEMLLKNTKTVFLETLKAFDEIRQLEKKINEVTHQISSRSDYHSKEYENLISQVTELNEKFAYLGGQTVEEDTEKVLTGLGFFRNDFDRPLSEFSNGWQMRVEIAKILLRRPDLLLLDEPTNHLDIESIQWLENFLSDYPGAVVLVSHDRAFLDNVSTRTVEIELGKVYDYKASYSEYLEMRETRLESQIAAFNNQQQQIRQIERFIERFRYKNTKSRQVQSRIKMLEKMEEIEIENMDQSGIHFRFPPAQPSGKVVVDAQHLEKNYGDFQVLSDLNFTILKGERVAFVGKNGEGKTTLARIITGELDFQGKLQLGYNVSIGYYAQNPAEMLDPEITVFETIDRVAVGDIRPKIRNMLGGFLFGEDDIDKKVKVLSGGEKARLALAKLLLEPVNLLVLDEPTNHLDMQSKDILKNALLQFQGTLVVVSHDRDFLQGLTTKVFEFRNKKIKEYLGDIYDFLEARKIASLKELELNKNSSPTISTNEPSENKQLYEKRKLLEKEIRRLGNQLEKCEKEIESLEKKISEMNTELADPSKIKHKADNSDYFSGYAAAKEKLNAKMDEWEQLSSSLEEMQKKKSNYF